MDKTPSLQQIAELLRSFNRPMDKLIVSLSAFSGVPWSVMVWHRSIMKWFPFPDYDRQLRRRRKIEPVEQVPTSVSVNFYGSEEGRHYRTFLCSEASEYLYEVLRDTDAKYPDLDSEGEAKYWDSIGRVANVVVRRHGLEMGGLRQYFCSSLFTAQRQKEADLTDEQIYFMLGEIDGYDYLERTTGTAQRKLVEDLRRQYARIEPKYFSTAPKKTDDGLLGDITPPKID